MKCIFSSLENNSVEKRGISDCPICLGCTIYVVAFVAYERKKYR